MIILPHHLRGIADPLLAEELSATLRHEVKNKLAAARNSVFFVKRKLVGIEEAPAPLDERVMRFLDLADQELVVAGQLLSPVPVKTEALPPVDIGKRFVLLKDWLASASLRVEPRGPLEAQVQVPEADVDLMLVWMAWAFATPSSRTVASLAVHREAGRVRVVTTSSDASVPEPLAIRLLRRLGSRWGVKVEAGEGGADAPFLSMTLRAWEGS